MRGVHWAAIMDHYSTATNTQVHCACDKIQMADRHLQQFALPPSIAVYELKN